MRYPDISIHCDVPREGLGSLKALTNPRIVIEVLSPSTPTLDQGTKLEEYKLIPSIATIAFVDPANEMCRTVERLCDEGWLDHMFSGQKGVDIPTLNLTIPLDEIFARD